MKIFRTILIGITMALATPALADNVRHETVRFAAGTSGSTINSKIKGYDTVEYKVGVSAGQKMSVELDSKNGSLYFKVTAPGASEAMYNSSVAGNGTSITIPSTGDYVIQVYLMRNAARREETAAYTLTLYVSP